MVLVGYAWLTIFAVGGFALSTTGHDAVVRSADSNDTCTSAECIAHAKDLKAAISPKYSSIDPCEDFSAYACDGFRQAHPIQPDTFDINTFDTMETSNDALLRTIVEGDFVEETVFPNSNRAIARENFNKLKASYAACMDEAAIKQAGVTPLRVLLAEFESLYPAKSSTSGSNSSSSNDELTDVLIWLSERRTPTLINIGIMADVKDAESSIWIDSVDTGVFSGNYDDTTIMASYKDTLVEMYRIVWDEGRNDVASGNASSLYVKQAEAVSKLESDLLHASTQDDKDGLNTLAELDQAIPQISMTKLFNTQAPTGYKIGKFNGKISYLKRLSSILKSTPREVLHAYFQSSIIKVWALRLDKSYYRPLTLFRNITGDDVAYSSTERWGVCLGETFDNFEYALVSFFLERAFSPEAKKQGDEMVDGILRELNSRLDALEWMSAATKVGAKQKLATIASSLGYPTSPNVLDAAVVQALYKDTIVTSSYFNNSVSGARQLQINIWKTLIGGDYLDNSRMRTSAAAAFYSRPDHRIVVPAGIMQPPLFSTHLPEYVSYGALGSVIGHELTHSVDMVSQKSVVDGKTTKLWDFFTDLHYKKTSQCFIDQFSNYTFDNGAGGVWNVDGENTLQENVADSGGIQTSYAAWKKREKTRPNQKLPGLENFTADQMFYLSYARMWCAVPNPKLAAETIKADVHSPDAVRILGTTSNSRGFREAFGCKKKEPTCQLW